MAFDETFGVPVCGPPEDWTPLEVIGVVKALDPNGSVEYWTFRSSDLSYVEAAGMVRLLTIEAEDELMHLAAQYDYIEESDDD